MNKRPTARAANWAKLCLPEKLRDKKQLNPYRKPTPVDGTSSLRRAGEGGLRNSAKQLGVSFQDALPEVCASLTSGCNKRVLAGCLPKTQVCAKAKAKVYRLRPAQRRKVKETCSRFNRGRGTEAPMSGGLNYKDPMVEKLAAIVKSEPCTTKGTGQ